MATIGAVHDLSGVGRCSLTAAISVLAALGHHCCPLPTAVLSKQTGFTGYSFYDFTSHMDEYLAGWEDINLKLDMVYTGFLGNQTQPKIITNFINRHPEIVLMVDPVMGDNGKPYPCFDNEFNQQMHLLVNHADIIVPNVTELTMLANREFKLNLTDQELFEMVLRLETDRLKHVVITGVVRKNRIFNYVVNLDKKEMIPLEGHYTGISYSGSGDLFASLLCGYLADHMDLVTAAQKSSNFLEMVAIEMNKEADPKYGLEYEKYLYLLGNRNYDYKNPQKL